MLTALTLLVVSQFPNATCLSANGTAVCGYDCQTASGRVSCARTPWGRCVTTNGQVFCGDPDPSVTRLGRDLPAVECLATNGTAECGYDCVKANGAVACARTPWGRCMATNGRIFCNDPEPWIGLADTEVPAMECLATNGTAACGYDCKKTNGTVACARTPWGRCTTTNGRVFCGDPQSWALRGGTPAVMDCLATNGTAACGYDCKATNGTVACASVPWGRCIATNGRVFCSE
jgi:hypothetical protein